MSVPSGTVAATGTDSPKRLAFLAATNVGQLEGIGAVAAERLRKMGIETVLDLVTYYPRDWKDRTTCIEIGALSPGDEATVRATIDKVGLVRPRGRRPFVSMVVSDEGNRLGVTFFNAPWRAKTLKVGMDVVLYGKANLYRSELSMVNPRLDVVGARDGFRETGRIVPIYRASEKAGMESYELARHVDRALRFADEHDAFADPLSEQRQQAFGLMSRSEAFHAIHQPASRSETEAARRRLAFDELWRLQVALVLRKAVDLESSRGIAHDIADVGGLVEKFIAGLPFPLTASQQRAIVDIKGDLRATVPMHRLLQGDVGSGKTVVALASLLFGVEGGHQGAFMVPTAVLAEQHFLLATDLLAGLEVDDPGRLTGRRPVVVALVDANTPGAERSRITAELAAGAIDILVGTHALLTEDVQFASLGVVVVDEQHRFGVDQRAALREKGSLGKDHDPDLLVMTATPIPRTAAMTVYGDLDQSTLDELPAGRSPITTRWVDEEEGQQAVWEAVRSAIADHEGVYVVCPLVRAGEPEEGDDQAELIEDEGRLFEQGDAPRAKKGLARALHGATQEHERLATEIFPEARVGLIHGQLPAKEKEKVMEAFRGGDLDVLVATIVIEVGIDVSRATVMVIEDADRFGIAQLHQLRGRVGRGKRASRCFLLAPNASPQAERRLHAVERSTDGFELAEEDLDLRGEGTVLGARQKGRSDLALASLRRDRDLVERARQLAEEIVASDPRLSRHPLFAEELRAFIDEQDAAYLFRS